MRTLLSSSTQGTRKMIWRSGSQMRSIRALSAYSGCLAITRPRLPSTSCTAWRHSVSPAFRRGTSSRMGCSFSSLLSCRELLEPAPCLRTVLTETAGKSCHSSYGIVLQEASSALLAPIWPLGNARLRTSGAAGGSALARASASDGARYSPDAGPGNHDKRHSGHHGRGGEKRHDECARDTCRQGEADKDRRNHGAEAVDALGPANTGGAQRVGIEAGQHDIDSPVSSPGGTE